MSTVAVEQSPPTAPPSPRSDISTNIQPAGMPAATTLLEAAKSGNLEVLDTWGGAVGLKVRDDAGMTPLLSAVKWGTTDTVRHMVTALGANLEERNVEGMTCLHMASERADDAAMLLVLLDELGKITPEIPGVDTRDQQQFTPLHVACLCGDVAAAKCLLKHGADLSATNAKGSTPLHWACSRGFTKVVKLLVGVYGADFACTAMNGSTPLHWAASKGRRTVVRLLLGTYCAQVDAKDDKGCTALMLAAYNGHTPTVRLLIDRFRAKPTIHDKKRSSLLHAASEMGHVELCSVLVNSYKANVECLDRKGLTPLCRAVIRNQVETFKLLVESYGANIYVLTLRKSGLLHLACEGGSTEMAKLLLEEHGFAVDARNADGDTPALCAAARGHADLLALLVDEYGASLDASDASGAGPLHKACQGAQSGAASVLIEEYGLPANHPGPNGITPLHLAARGGNASLAELLTGPIGRADPGLKDEKGNQALHIAAACGHLDVVKVMVEKAGADLAAKNALDKSALDVAVGGAKTDVADYLRGVCTTNDEHTDESRARAGFKRAGKWMGLGNAAGYLQDLSLDNVLLLPAKTLLDHGRFPSNYDAYRKRILVKASEIAPAAQVLLVSHPWESPGNPDPSGRQFTALRRYMEFQKEGDGFGFDYVWVAFSCTSSNRIKPDFKVHFHNILTAWCLADGALVLPEMISRQQGKGIGLTCSGVADFVHRGSCCVELLCALHLGVPTTLHIGIVVDGTSAGEKDVETHVTSVKESKFFSVFEQVEQPSYLSMWRNADEAELPVGLCMRWAVQSASRNMCSVISEAYDGAADFFQPEELTSVIWTVQAETHMNDVVRSVGKVISVLEAEVAGGIESSRIAGDARAPLEPSTAISAMSLDGGKGKSCQLLSRILSLTLLKHDVEDGTTSSSADSREAEGEALVRGLYENLGTFSGSHENLEATNTLLLAGCYVRRIMSERNITT